MTDLERIKWETRNPSRRYTPIRWQVGFDKYESYSRPMVQVTDTVWSCDPDNRAQARTAWAYPDMK